MSLPRLERPVPMTAWAKAALVFVVLVGVALALADRQLTLGVLGTSALLLVAATYAGLACLDSVRRRLAAGRFLAVEHALALALPWLGHGRTAIAPLAAISLTGLVLKPRWVAIPAAVHLLNVLAACWLFFPREAGVFVVLNFLVASVFVIAFTEAVSREVRTRERLDASTRKLEAQAALSEEVATLGERARIARELHDSLGHALTAAHVQLQVAARHLAAPTAEGRGALQSAQRAIREGLDELRATVRTLHAPAAKIVAIEPALQRLLDDHRGHLEGLLRVEGEPAHLPPHLSLAVYRTVQESLTNVVKHAGARGVEVSLRYGERAIELSIRDDGRGLAPDAKEGFGLRGLRDRIEGLGGSVSCASAPGLCVNVRIPLDIRPRSAWPRPAPRRSETDSRSAGRR